MTFKYIDQAGITKAEALRRARQLRREGQKRGLSLSLQQAVDCVIDAAIEHAQ